MDPKGYFLDWEKLSKEIRNPNIEIRKTVLAIFDIDIDRIHSKPEIRILN
jgi:hypothetical protein